MVVVFDPNKRAAKPETRLRWNICEEPLDIFNRMSQHFPAVLFSIRSQIFSDKTSGHLSHVCGTKPEYFLMKHQDVWSLVCGDETRCFTLSRNSIFFFFFLFFSVPKPSPDPEHSVVT